MKYNKSIGETSLIMAKQVLRNNSIIEDLHSQGKITQEEMKQINKDCVNNIYTIFMILRHPQLIKNREELTEMMWVPNWDKPEMAEWSKVIIK